MSSGVAAGTRRSTTAQAYAALPGDDHRVDVSIVVPALDCAKTIGAQLNALLEQEWSGSWEVIVADNGSSDGTAAVLDAAALRSDHRLIRADASSRRGPAHARNCGAAMARGDTLLFCDADDIVAPGWLAAMAEAMRASEAATGVQELGSLNPRWLVAAACGEAPPGPQTFEGIFPFGPSANFGVRKQVFQALGGFDETIAVGEDLELCLRLWDHGHALAHVPHAVVHYRLPTAVRALFLRAVRYGAAGPLVVRRLVELDRPRPARVRGLRSWAWLLRHIPLLRSRSGRARWLTVAGRAIGRLIGSARQRTVFL